MTVYAKPFSAAKPLQPIDNATKKVISNGPVNAVVLVAIVISAAMRDIAAIVRKSL